MLIMSDKIKFYSIESRKGGVGKTTIALNLAKALLNRGPVLLLDCDITGTSISEPASNSVYWQNVTNVIMDEKETPKNLLKYYLSHYIRGRADVNEFMPQKALLASKINIIGSEIYGEMSKAIVDTRLLMDEIHSFWLMEFIDAIIQTFDKRFESNDSPLHVIIDNSPGYVGFCQALHEYMFQLGPLKAKFVMVSSVDAQDLQSCIAASAEIHQAISGRLEMAAYYKSMMEGGKEKEQKEQILDNNAELRDFFVELSDKQMLLDNYICDVTSPDQYVSLILNKVPANLNEESISYTFSDVIGKDNIPFFHKITSAKDDMPRTIIYYDEAISYQYYYRFLKVKERKTIVSKYDWTSRYKELNDKNNAYSLMADRMEVVNFVDKLFIGLQNSLNNQGYISVLKALLPSWRPMYTIDKLAAVLKDIHQYAVLKPDNSTIDQELLNKWLDGQLAEMQKYIGDTLEFQNIKYLMKYIVSPKNSIDNVKRTDSEIYVLYTFLHLICTITLRHVGIVSLREFFLSEYRQSPFCRNWQEYIKEYVFVTDVNKAETKLVRKPDEYYFSHFFEGFYRVFCYTFIRMVDIHNDFDAVLSAVRLYVPASSAIGFSKDMKDYLHNVIYKKSALYDRDKLSAIKERFFAMTSLQTVIRNYVIKNW